MTLAARRDAHKQGDCFNSATPRGRGMTTPAGALACHATGGFNSATPRGRGMTRGLPWRCWRFVTGFNSATPRGRGMTAMTGFPHHALEGASIRPRPEGVG